MSCNSTANHTRNSTSPCAGIPTYSTRELYRDRSVPRKKGINYLKEDDCGILNLYVCNYFENKTLQPPTETTADGAIAPGEFHQVAGAITLTLADGTAIGDSVAVMQVGTDPVAIVDATPATIATIPGGATNSIFKLVWNGTDWTLN